MVVTEFPPRLSFSSHVSTESRYGIKICFLFLVDCPPRFGSAREDRVENKKGLMQLAFKTMLPSPIFHCCHFQDGKIGRKIIVSFCLLSLNWNEWKQNLRRPPIEQIYNQHQELQNDPPASCHCEKRSNTPLQLGM